MWKFGSATDLEEQNLYLHLIAAMGNVVILLLLLEMVMFHWPVKTFSHRAANVDTQNLLEWTFSILGGCAISWLLYQN